MIKINSPAKAQNAFRHSRSGLKTAALAMLLLAAGLAPLALPAAEAAMKLTVVNRSGYSDDQVYFIMICQAPLGYLDFRNHVLVETPSFSLDAAAMTATLAQLKEYSGDGSATISCPAMGSSRIYFALGKNFDQMGGFTASGPETGAANPIPWAMFEANLAGGKFLNQGNVDFFSIAYTLAATRNTGEAVTVGITTPSETVFQEFAAIPSPADSAQHSGNTEIFKALIVKNAAGQTVRVVAPKAAALGNVNTDDALPQMFTHFLDDYVNNHCWRPNREFSFSSKLAGDTATYYGKVSADGLTLSIYTDAALTVPYAVPTLPRPSNAWGNPDFKNRGDLWHNVGVTSTVPANIDWGYLLYGQDGYPSGPGAHWITDPVAMAIPVSIVRGVMHLDNGTVDWKDSAKYYQGTNGASTADFPVFYYGKILHQLGLAGKVYALSFDDVYGTDSGIGFTNPDVTLALYPFSAAPLGPGITANGVATNLTVNYPEPVSVAVTLNPGEFAGLPVDWWFIAYAHSGEWFYLDRNVQWPSFGGDFTLCRPVYQGPLFNLTSFAVLDSLPLPRGTYDFWFAVDYPMDGILFPNMALMFDHVTVVVQ